MLDHYRALIFFGKQFQTFQSSHEVFLLCLVSLTTTPKISFDVFSCSYLDDSVHYV